MTSNEDVAAAAAANQTCSDTLMTKATMTGQSTANRLKKSKFTANLKLSDSNYSAANHSKLTIASITSSQVTPIAITQLQGTQNSQLYPYLTHLSLI